MQRELDVGLSVNTGRYHLKRDISVFAPFYYQNLTHVVPVSTAYSVAYNPIQV